jgi:host factor-I protein
MPHTPEPPSAPIQTNIQDAFLNRARRERLSVAIRMMDGTAVEGRIKLFDRFAIIVEQNGADQLIFKHAIAVISMPPTAGGDVATDQS